MRACLVVPCSRPERLPELLAAWRSQTLPCRLVLAVRDPREPQWRGARAAGAVVAREDGPSAGQARNAGMRRALELGHEWAILLDDDNYLGPRYAETVMEHARPGVSVLSQGFAFIRLADGLWLFRSRKAAPSHCTSVRLPAPEFDAGWDCDVRWSRKVEVTWLPPWHLVYRRTGGGHLWEAPDLQVHAAHGPARRVGDVPDAFVDHPADLRGIPEYDATEDFFRAMEARCSEA